MTYKFNKLLTFVENVCVGDGGGVGGVGPGGIFLLNIETSCFSRVAFCYYIYIIIKKEIVITLTIFYSA
jgi:hypothetical protein